MIQNEEKINIVEGGENSAPAQPVASPVGSDKACDVTKSESGAIYGLSSEGFELKMNQSLDAISKAAGDYFNEQDAERVRAHIKKMALTQRLVFIIVALLLPVIVLNFFIENTVVRIIQIVLVSAIIVGMGVLLTVFIVQYARLKKLLKKLSQNSFAQN